VGFSPLLYADTTANTGQDKAFAVATNHAPILCWKANFSRHGNFTGYINVTLSQKRIIMISFPSQSKKGLNSLSGYTPCRLIHHLTDTIVLCCGAGKL